MRFILGLTAMLLSPACFSANWLEVEDFPDKGIKVYVDAASLQAPHAPVVQGWVRIAYAEPRLMEGEHLQGYSSLRMVDCKERRYTVTEAWGYRPDDKRVKLTVVPMPEWQLAPPDSEEQAAMDGLCSAARSLPGTLWEKFSNGLMLLRMSL